MEVDVVSLCPEFPNDNPALHGGVSWVCLEVTGQAVAVRERIDAEPAREAPLIEVPPIEAPLIEAPAEAVIEPELLIALVTESRVDVAAEIAEVAGALALAIDADAFAGSEPASVSVADLLAPFEIEDVPAPRISGIVPVGQDLHLEDEDDEDEEFLVEELPPLEETACFEGVVAPERVAASSTTLPPAIDDPFVILLTTLADVAVGAGSPHVASLLPGLLLHGRLDRAMSDEAVQALVEADVVRGAEGTVVEVTERFTAQIKAWRAILGGTSDDFSACGNAMLDEWASELLARLLGAPSRATALRRELRERGVAAFGLVEAA